MKTYTTPSIVRASVVRETLNKSDSTVENDALFIRPASAGVGFYL